MSSVYNSLKCINPIELLEILDRAHKAGSYLFKLPTSFESAYVLYAVEHRFSTILSRVSGADAACFELCERDLKRVPIGVALTAWLLPPPDSNNPSRLELKGLSIGLAWDSHPSAYLIAAQDLLGLTTIELETNYINDQRIEATRCARILFPAS